MADIHHVGNGLYVDLGEIEALRDDSQRSGDRVTTIRMKSGESYGSPLAIKVLLEMMGSRSESSEDILRSTRDLLAEGLTKAAP
jgi:hypothetical protein